MATTYEPIATTTVNTGTGQVTFSSISAGYTDLVIQFRHYLSGVDNLAIRFNNDATSTYSITRLISDGSTVTSTNSINSTYPVVDTAIGAYTNLHTFNIFSYSNTSTYKPFLVSCNKDENGSGEVIRDTGIWRNTSAITRIDFYGSIGNPSTITIYGIKAA